VLAVALIAASASWSRLVATSLTAATLTGVSQIPSQSPWTWWAPMIAGLALTLFFARVPAQREGAMTSVAGAGATPPAGPAPSQGGRGARFRV
jgi:hypothetical protein